MTNENDFLGYNRRDFLKGGSVATLMTMLGGVELLAQPAATPPTETKAETAKAKAAVIGIGSWGREILNTLAKLEQAEIAAICDTYPAMLKRGANVAPKATQTANY